MSTVPVVARTILKKSLGWSIALSVLMLLAGFLAIVVPPIVGIAVAVFVAWLLVFSGAAHLVFAWHTRTTGGIIWELLLGQTNKKKKYKILKSPITNQKTQTQE